MKRILVSRLLIAVLVLIFTIPFASAEPQVDQLLTIDMVQDAATRLQGTAFITPLLFSDTFSGQSQVYLKLESLQRTGSFKLRGAYVAMSRLSADERAKGVCACSAGNHAQGVAYAAKAMGIAATIFIPANAAEEKVEATRAYGVDVRLVGDSFEAAEEAALKYANENDMTFIAPYDDVNVISGQATIGLEILAQCPNVDVIVAPVGGGGLISGIAFTVKTLKPDVLVYGVQTETNPGMKTSLEAGHVVDVGEVKSIADGIAVGEPGQITFALCAKYLDGIVTTSDQEISETIYQLLRHQKIIVEGAGAVSLAAVLYNKLPIEGKNVVCVISGGNIDDETLMTILDTYGKK